MTASANQYKEDRVGFGIIKPAQGIYEISSEAKAELGFRLLVGDRVFRYAYAGGVALAAGKLVYPASLSSADWTNKAVAAAAAAGSYEVTVTTASAATHAAGGYLSINDATGEGLTYRIKSAKANATTATSTDLVLYDPIITALTTSSEATILSSLYYDLDVCAGATSPVVGVPPVPVTANYYFWVQTWGPCAVLQTGADAAGSIMVEEGGSSNGAVGIQAAYTANIVGFQLIAGSAGEYRPLYLRIAP